MAQPTFPGVFIREVSSGVRTITGVATSIAAFVGMAKRGQINEPTRVLGFTDYTRIFLDDSSLGEMTLQVRQFFQNGGQQAFIVRVADDPASAFVDLDNEAGTPTLTLTARDPGAVGNELRARVDYNTSSPERTFNLTIYRETFNASGQPVLQDVETHTLLSMDPGSSRFVVNVLADGSALARAQSAGLAATTADSVSGLLFGLATDAEAAFLAAIENTLPGGAGTEGRFRIRVGNSPFVTISIPVAPPPTLVSIQGLVNAQLTPHGVSIALNFAGGLLRFVAGATGQDVIIESAGQFDIAAAMALGTANGGIEIGSYAGARPAPSGLVSRLDVAAKDLVRLVNTGNVLKTDVNIVSINTVMPFSTDPIAFAPPGTDLNEGAIDPPPSTSLRNLKANLQTIVSAINTGPDWRAELHGYRIAITARFGNAASGANATLSSIPAAGDLGSATRIFGGVTSTTAAFSLASGLDGDPPTRADYTDAFTALKEKVDLFNILVLPRSFNVQGTAVARSAIWGEASAFVQSERAFLLVDQDPAVDEVGEMEAAIVPLRVGVQKDHAAVYWPRVAVVDAAGARQIIDSSGSVAGIMARTDASRGVWKAPAGLEAAVRGVTGVETLMSDEQNGILNPLAVNAIRAYPEGVVVWGARTMDGFDNSGNDDYKYVPVRRFALFIEESLVRGLRFAVFEPNGEALWGQIRLAAGAFLNGLFRQGAFAGAKQSDAFFVKVDAETTTPTDINLGIVNVVVGFAPLKPAEFVIITIKQQTAQVQV